MPSEVNVKYGINIDFSKTFNKVNIDLPIAQLNVLGVVQIIRKRIKRVLTNSIQSVIVNNFISDGISVYSGVLQGSPLIPMVFLIFVNDVSKLIRKARFHMFACDLKLFMSITT